MQALCVHCSGRAGGERLPSRSFRDQKQNLPVCLATQTVPRGAMFARVHVTGLEVRQVHSGKCWPITTRTHARTHSRVHIQCYSEGLLVLSLHALTHTYTRTNAGINTVHKDPFTHVMHTQWHIHQWHRQVH